MPSHYKLFDRRFLAHSQWIVVFGMMASFLYLILRFITPGAYYDLWEMIFLSQYWESGQLDIAHFFEKHYGTHVLAIPKLLYLMEFQIFHGQGFFLIFMSCMLHLASYFLIIRRIHSDIDSAIRWPLQLITSTVFFCAWQIPNMLYAFQVQWFLIEFLAMVSLSALPHWKAHHSRFPAASILSAALASLCGFAGVVLLLLVLLVVILQTPFRVVRYALSALLAATAYVYLPGEMVVRIADHQATFHSQQELLARFSGMRQAFFPGFFTALLTWFGNPWSLLWPAGGLWIGGVVIVILGKNIGSFAVQARQKVDFWGLLTLYAVGTMVSVGIGRYMVGGVGTEDRYVMIYSFLVIALFYWLGYMRIRPFVMGALVSVYLILFGITEYIYINRSHNVYQDQMRANVNILNGISENMAYKKFTFYIEAMVANPVKELYGYLKSHDMDVFYRQPQQLPELSANADQCEAVIDRKFYLPNNRLRDYYLSIWDQVHNAPVLEWYLVKNGRVYFYGTTYEKTFQWRPLRWTVRNNLESYTSLPESEKFRDFTLVGRKLNGEYCAITLMSSSQKPG